MSHISNISTEGLEFDLDTVKALCRRQGWEFMEDQTSMLWYGHDVRQCDHAIKIPGCRYELGLTKNPSGDYSAVADFWQSGGLNTVLGDHGEVFKQLYLQTSDILWAESKNYGWEVGSMDEQGATKLSVFVSDDFGGGEEGW